MYQHLQNIIIKMHLSDFQTVLRCNVGVISEQCSVYHLLTVMNLDQ